LNAESANHVVYTALFDGAEFDIKTGKNVATRKEIFAQHGLLYAKFPKRTLSEEVVIPPAALEGSLLADRSLQTNMQVVIQRLDCAIVVTRFL